jgi:hypothetical protein
VGLDCLVCLYDVTVLQSTDESEHLITEVVNEDCTGQFGWNELQSSHAGHSSEQGLEIYQEG